jgi:sugar-specific transcriptional regulator TrmB
MDGYLVWLVFLALAIFSLSIIQLQESKNKRLQESCVILQNKVERGRNRLREKEDNIDRLQHDYAQLLKYRERAFDLERELSEVKQTERYASAERQRLLEDHLSRDQRNPGILFLGTIPSLKWYTFEDRLRQMLERAEWEIVIASPWIKRSTWERMDAPLSRFSRRGGRLRVFMRGSEADYSMGLSDDISEEVRLLKGEIRHISGLHAKIYMVDRREAIIASANLTKGGTEANRESGVWLDDPSVLKEICAFVEGMSNQS